MGSVLCQPQRLLTARGPGLAPFSGTLSSTACWLSLTSSQGHQSQTLGGLTARVTVFWGDWHMAVLLPGLGLSGAQLFPRPWNVVRFSRWPSSSHFQLLCVCLYGTSREAASLPRSPACLLSGTSWKLCGLCRTGQWSVSKALPFVPGAWPAQGLTLLPDGGSTSTGVGQAAPRPVGPWLGSTFAWPTGAQGDKIMPQPASCPVGEHRARDTLMFRNEGDGAWHPTLCLPEGDAFCMGLWLGCCPS